MVNTRGNSYYVFYGVFIPADKIIKMVYNLSLPSEDDPEYDNVIDKYLKRFYHTLRKDGVEGFKCLPVPHDSPFSNYNDEEIHTVALGIMVGEAGSKSYSTSCITDAVANAEKIFGDKMNLASQELRKMMETETVGYYILKDDCNCCS